MHSTAGLGTDRLRFLSLVAVKRGHVRWSPLQCRGFGATTPSGLASVVAQKRLHEFGPNELRRQEVTNRLTLFARQFASPVIWLLLGASTVSLALGELLDTVAIGVIVIVNAVIGFLQEHRAERAVIVLRSASSTGRRFASPLRTASRLIVALGAASTWPYSPVVRCCASTQRLARPRQCVSRAWGSRVAWGLP